MERENTNMTYTSVSRDKLQQAFGLAHKLSESPSIPTAQRHQFRAIAILIWEAHGEPGAPPPESGAILLAKFGVYGESTAPSTSSVRRIRRALESSDLAVPSQLNKEES